jgi:hypothetical protein
VDGEEEEAGGENARPVSTASANRSDLQGTVFQNIHVVVLSGKTIPKNEKKS